MVSMKQQSLKFIPIIFALILSVLLPASAGADTPNLPPGKNIKIVATFFPIYLFARNITDGIAGIDLEMLLPAAYGCPHDISVAPEDLKKINDADIIIQNGLGMEPFLKQALGGVRSDMYLITGADSIKPIPLTYYEEDAHHFGDTSLQYNPHVFASPKTAALMIRHIAAQLAEAIPDRADRLMNNSRQSAQRVEKLSAAFSDSLQNLKNPRLITVHEVFDYMARDYGFQIAGVIEKEPGQEPSAREMVAMEKAFRALKPAGLFYEPQYSSKIVEILGREIGAAVYSLDPVASGPTDPPLDYYEQIMYKDLQTLVKALK